ncbi:MAG: TolC family protein [Calditrichota bacterium]
MQRIGRIVLLLLWSFAWIGPVTAQTRSLDYYVTRAIRHNPQINDQQVAIDSAGLDIKLAKAELARPLLYTTADYISAPVYGKYGYDTNITDGGLYAALLNLEYPILHYRKLAVRTREGETAQRKFSDNIRLLGHNLRTAVTSQYITAYQNLGTMRYLRDVFSLLQKQEAMLKSLVQQGLVHVTDLQQIDIEIRRLRIEQTTAQNDYISSLKQLNVLSGIQDSLDVELLAPPLIPDTSHITQSQFLEQFRLDSLQLSIQEKVQELKYRPTLSVITTTGLNSSQTAQPAGLRYNYGYSIGLHFSAILYDGRQKDLNRQKITVARRSITGHRSNLANERTANLQSLRQRLKHVTEQLTQMNQQIKSYQSLLNTYSAELARGELSIIDYLTVLRNYLDSRNQQQQIQGTHLQLINEFKYWLWLLWILNKLYDCLLVVSCLSSGLFL